MCACRSVPDRPQVLPMAVLVSTSLMIWVDVGARTMMAPQELPVGIITVLLGAPFFVRNDRLGLKTTS
ncbi:MAG: iron chelate uptake ABC transporter family permease subunit [Egibacteraceae bacterium]